MPRILMPSAPDGMVQSHRFSPSAANLIGVLVTARIESAAPPLVSPSSFVRTTPVKTKLFIKAFRDIDRILTCHRVNN